MSPLALLHELKWRLSQVRTDVILGIQEPYMQQMVDGEKNYEFRKYRLQQTVQRIWFYSIAPHSRIEYVCEIEPAVTRNEGDPKLPENGLGNKEYNEFHKDWDRYDFAYKILSVYKLDKPVTLADLKKDFGLGGAPQGMVYTPSSLTAKVLWQKQTKLR
jgi:predicted transcriptional regulator